MLAIGGVTSEQLKNATGFGLGLLLAYKNADFPVAYQFIAAAALYAYGRQGRNIPMLKAGAAAHVIYGLGTAATNMLTGAAPQ